MNTNITIRTVFAGLLFMCMILGCTKEGDVGPRGEDGMHGVDGEDGTRIYTGSAAPTADIGDIGDFYFRTSNSDFYGPKSDAGWGTATNLRGATGATGAQGSQGPAGAAGSRILSGTAVPTTGTGAVGDFYFRTITADFYGPKAASGWGTPINLKGVKGDDGSRIYSGTAVPATSLGNVGDFYFRTNTSDFYGPKTASSWGMPTNLRGATGATGAQGPAGTPGSKILSGASAPATSLGAIGDYYIHTGTANLYGPKTASGWGSPIVNLRAPQNDVIYSEWLVPEGLAQNSRTGDISGSIYVSQLSLVNALYDNAAINVYMQENITNNPTSPDYYISQLNCKGVWAYWADFSYRINQSNHTILLLITNTGFDIGTAHVRDNIRFRYVIIPGNSIAPPDNRASNRNNHVTPYMVKQDYNELKNHYNIPD